MDGDILFEQDDLQFEWSIQKARLNLRKHRVSFEEATEVFYDPFRQYGEASCEGELRESILGFSFSQNLLLIVYIERGARTRLISARRATNQEREIYGES